MRYLMLVVLAAMITAPLVGCTETKETKRNPFTGSTTTTNSMDTH